MIERLLADEKDRFWRKTKEGRALAKRAVGSMPAGIPTDVFYLWPYPIAVREGLGSSLVDFDGNRFVDFSMGFGVAVWGHAHPALVRAISDRAARGSHFGALSREVVSWSESLLERYGGNWIRFSNSGTEATMDALRFARAQTGRIPIAKIDGAYHGSHEVALVNANFPDSESIQYRPAGAGLSPRLQEEVRVLAWNDLEAAEKLIPGSAALLVEPIMFNVGAIWPENGYLEALREICDREGTLLIFDETKTGHTLAWGGAEEIFRVQPDIKTLGKGIGGGLPCGAILGTRQEGYDMLDRGDTPHLGTFSGSHLAASAGAAAMRLMTHKSYERLEALRMRLESGIERIIEEHELPAYSQGQGAKNCLVWANRDAGPLRNFADYCRRFDGKRAEALWFWMFNRGVWLAQGQDEQTTHSIAHSEEDIDRFLDIFEEGAPLLK